jgi:hypothetical protein
MTTIYTQDDLKGRMTSPGWALITGQKEQSVSGTLAELLGITHDRHKSGRAPGLIREIETAIELDMIQIEQLWRYLGLPD